MLASVTYYLVFYVMITKLESRGTLADAKTF